MLGTLVNRLGCRGSVPQSIMRLNGIVLNAPLLNQDFSLLQRIEDFYVELISHLAIEAFDIAILQRTAGFDEQGLDRQAAPAIISHSAEHVRPQSRSVPAGLFPDPPQSILSVYYPNRVHMRCLSLTHVPSAT